MPWDGNTVPKASLLLEPSNQPAQILSLLRIHRKTLVSLLLIAISSTSVKET